MRIPDQIIKSSLFLCICGFGTLFQSCSTSNRIYTEADVVYSTKRSELKYTVKDHDRRSPLFYLTQSIVKETGPDKETSFTVYDLLSLSADSYKMDDKVIFIVDKEVFPMKIKNIELENIRDITENTGTIMTSDSTTVSVISGFTESNRKITRFSYNIPDAAIAKIRESDRLSIRYYSGPSMITLSPKKKSLNKLKELIELE